MEEIRVLLQSPSFWFAAFITGLIFSIIGNLLSFSLNKFFAKYSKKLREKRDKKNNEIKEIIEKSKKNLCLKVSLQISCIEYILYLFFSVLFFYISAEDIGYYLRSFLPFYIYLIVQILFIMFITTLIIILMKKLFYYFTILSGLKDNE